MGLDEARRTVDNEEDIVTTRLLEVAKIKPEESSVK